MAKEFLPKAYSYVRFSTPEQHLGDSMRRQVAAAEHWCKKEGYVLDVSLRDEGISAYRRKNASKGALGTFLRSIEAGEVPRNSVLIVESLDRLSRAEPLEALDQLRLIIDAGVNVVTLDDGQRYTSTVVREIGPLFQALILMSRAHEESHTKARRIGEVWSEKRKKALASSRPMTRQTPAWIKVLNIESHGSRNDFSNARFEIDEGRAAIVRQIFEFFTRGMGKVRIAAELNRRGIAVWGRGRRRAKGGWQESYISKILKNRAVIGEHQPCRRDPETGERKPEGEVLTNYYPAAISLDLWYAAQSSNSPATRSKGRPSSSAVLSGLVLDPNGCPMHVERKGSGWDYYATSRAFRRDHLTAHRWRLDHIESLVVSVLKDLDWKAVFVKADSESKLERLRGEEARLDEEIRSTDEKLTAVADRLLRPDFEILSEQLLASASALKNKKDRLCEERSAAHERLEQAMGEAKAEVIGIDELRSLAVAKKNPETFVRLRRQIKALVKSITLYPDGRIDGYPIDEIRSEASARLTGTKAIMAKRQGRVVGAFRIEFINGKLLTLFATYRPSERAREAPAILFADGVGYSLEEIPKVIRAITEH